MTIIRPKGFQVFKDRLGRWRCYHRSSRTPIDVVTFPIGSAEFLGECQRIVSLYGKAAAPRAGTLAMLISLYRAHEAFTDLAERTRSDYQRCFDYPKPIGDTPLVSFKPVLVVAIRDKAAKRHGRRFGTYVNKCCRRCSAGARSGVILLAIRRCALGAFADPKTHRKPIGRGATMSERRCSRHCRRT